MPVEIDAYGAAGTLAHKTSVRRVRNSIVIGLVNNMPDAALESTEAQFSSLLLAAAGTARSVRLRFTSIPELSRGAQARQHIARSYWPIETLLAEAPDALIVTGTEPVAPRLREEPYWPRLAALLDWADAHCIASVWSCLAAHAAAEHFDGIARRRLAQKRCGVYAHGLLAGHALLEGVAAPLPMPHSRWNELPIEALRAAGYAVLSFSPETGADAFVRHERSLMLFFQGHPEYEDTTLLKEYRRDVGRYLAGQQPHYPTMPHGYLPAEAVTALESFRERALARRAPELLGGFPFAAVAAVLANTWRPSSVAIYRNWLDFIAAARTRGAEEVSLAGL
ncbi:MAG TPA: homoserine O-succinyltransferase [Steroidobacteraceae bacterium]|nr:homoserine O-succinyltransferase [Steroidobacteraceae bacterium]